MELFSSYNLIIEISIIIIFSFLFNEISRKTNIPSVLMLIVLGILLKLGLDAAGLNNIDFFPILEVLGIIGLIMIVLEAALELELKPEKMLPISTAFLVALVGMLLTAWALAIIMFQLVPGMTMTSAWLYATSLAILSSSIIIPSVTGLTNEKKEFHIYESTFSDILGIMLFYFLSGKVEAAAGGQTNGIGGFFANITLTIVISLVASYLIILIFQNIKSNVKLFLLIAVLLLLYAIGKKMHLSSLLIILIFGLLIANMPIFFRGKLGRLLHVERATNIYEGLHVLTMETAFVVRTLFFVIFGLTISLAALFSWHVALVSGLIILSIYVIRFLILRIFLGSDILPQLFIAPRGLITILLFYAIPKEAQIEGFEPGILLFIIITTSVLMTVAMIHDKHRSYGAVKKAQSKPVGYEKWKAPTAHSVIEAGKEVKP